MLCTRSYDFKWLKSHDPVDNSKNQQYKNMFTKISKKAEANYYKTMFDKLAIPKNLGSDEQNCSFKNTFKKILISKIKIDNTEIILPEEISDKINK